jgi:hypothetical protein
MTLEREGEREIERGREGGREREREKIISVHHYMKMGSLVALE